LGADLHGGEGAGGGGVGKDLGEELLGLEERGIVVRVLLPQELVDGVVLHEHARDEGENIIVLAAVEVERWAEVVAEGAGQCCGGFHER
jgi:hypothetical protein